MQTFFIKIDRLAAWVLFIGFFLYFVSGYGMTKGIIDASLAGKLHLNYLTYIIVIAFVLHTSFAIHLALLRWNVSKIISVLILVIFYLFFIISFIYVDRYFVKPESNIVTLDQIENITNEEDDEDIPMAVTTRPALTPTAVSTVKTFTPTELSKFNGQNGSPAYVAVDGDVYDLTRVFVSGKHFSHFAGTELTNAFYSYHAKRSLSKYPIVGKLTK